MKWAPEDRLNAFSARLLAEQPDPPRSVGLGELLSANLPVLGFLPFPALVAVAGYLAHQPLAYLVVGPSAILLLAAVVWQRMSDARSALQSGVAATGRVTRVEPGYRSGKIVTIDVEGAPASRTSMARSGAANVLVEGDVVQVMVDPDTRQVLLVLSLLHPSPLYAPPVTHA